MEKGQFSMERPKRKRVVITIQDKLEILKQLEDGVSARELAKKYNIGFNTVHDVKKNKDKLVQFSLAASDSIYGIQNRRTMRKSPYDLLDKALLHWFNQERSLGRPVNGPMCSKQAKLLFETLGLEGNFDASSGWLCRFKDRYGIRTVGDTMDCLWTRTGVVQGHEKSSKDDCGKVSETVHQTEDESVVDREYDGSNMETSSEQRVSIENDDQQQSAQTTLTQKHNEVVPETDAKETSPNQITPHKPSVEKKKSQDGNNQATVIPQDSESVDQLDFINLKSVVKKLEMISDKLSSVTLDDSYDQFGKYVGSLLRGLPSDNVLCLKRKIVNDVLDAVFAYERGKETPRNSLASKSVAPEQTSSTSSKDILEPSSNFLPQPNDFQASKSSSSEDLTMSEDVNIISKTINQVSTQKQSKSYLKTNSTKQKKPISSMRAFLLKQKCLKNQMNKKLPLAIPGDTNPSSSFTLLPVVPVSGPPSITRLAANNTPSSSQITKTIPLSPWESIRTISTTSDGTLLAVTIPRIPPPGRSQEQIVELAPDSSVQMAEGNSTSNLGETGIFGDFEVDMDVEEGSELKDFKSDHALFETVICDDNEFVKVKEEPPDSDAERPCEESRVKECDLCAAPCATRGDLVNHFKENHPGCVPTFKEGSVLSPDLQELS